MCARHFAGILTGMHTPRRRGPGSGREPEVRWWQPLINDQEEGPSQPELKRLDAESPTAAGPKSPPSQHDDAQSLARVQHPPADRKDEMSGIDSYSGRSNGQ
jgi:hypothetical protein